MQTLSPSLAHPFSLPNPNPRALRALAATPSSSSSTEDGDLKTLVQLKSAHNHIRVVEVSNRARHPLAGARLLLLDSPGNIHSISFPSRPLTSSYLDAFATLPPLLPEGPVALLGFGAGSASRVLLHYFPDLHLLGFELDSSVLTVAREHLGLRELENRHKANLVVRVGDALEAEVEGGFAGMVVDLFAKGSVLRELQEKGTFERLRGRLREGGRMMVNCGGRSLESEEEGRDGGRIMAETLKVMGEVFGSELMVLNVGEAVKGEDSCLAMTGGLVDDVPAWKGCLPEELRVFADLWRSCSYVDSSGDIHEVDANDVLSSRIDPLASLSENLIDGINQNRSRRRALMLFCFVHYNTHARDALMLAIDKKGFNVLAKVHREPASSSLHQYQWKEFRFTFKDEVPDVEAFCCLLVQMEEEALKYVKSFSGIG